MNGQQWNRDDFPMPCNICNCIPKYFEGSDCGIQVGFFKCKICGRKGKSVAAFIGNPAVWDIPYNAAKNWNELVRGEVKE